MKKVIIELTRADAIMLMQHWRANLDYGAGGTFGDGDDFVSLNKNGDEVNSIKDFRRGEQILEKIKSALKQNKKC